jgi:Tol biopolymer transport system component
VSVLCAISTTEDIPRRGCVSCCRGIASWIGREAEVLAGSRGDVYLPTVGTRGQVSVRLGLCAVNRGSGPRSDRRRDLDRNSFGARSHARPLYDVGQDAGVEFLVMPCLEGETLASRLDKGALSLERAVAIATQIADALDRAHRAGFVHRDLKPANIMLTKGSGARHGEVHATLLDFGLAKLTASPVALNPSLAATQPPPQANLTGDATLVGTLQYMAPEQIEGKPVDARADLFALGAILHEMITGRPAFAAASPASVIAAILAHDPPPLSATATSVSPALDATVQRCLAKSADDRFQSASDLRFALQTLGHEPPHGADVGPHRGRRTLPVSAVLTVAGAITLAGIGWMVTRPRSYVPASVPSLLNPLQVTNAVGVEDDAAWSPDGRTLAYAANPSGGIEAGNWDIWVVQPGGTQSLNRTPDSAADDRFPAWSPDGKLLAFWSNRDGGGCYVMPTLAGSPRRIAEASLQDPNPPAWSADGNQLACVTLDGTDVYATIHTLRGGSSRRVALPGPVKSRRLFQIVADPAPDWGGTWSPDGRYIAFFSYRSGNRDLWRVAVNGGPAEQLTDHPAPDLLPNWAPDGQTIAFLSSRADRAGIWLLPTGGGQPRPVPTSEEMLGPQWSPDGRWLAVLSVALELWRISPTGADPEVRLVDQVRAIGWSHDSRSIYFTGQGTRQNTVFAVPTDGGPERALVDLSGRRGMIGDIATDGPNLFFTWEENLGDLWVADVVQAPPHSR